MFNTSLPYSGTNPCLILPYSHRCPQLPGVSKIKASAPAEAFPWNHPGLGRPTLMTRKAKELDKNAEGKSNEQGNPPRKDMTREEQKVTEQLQITFRFRDRREEKYQGVHGEDKSEWATEGHLALRAGPTLLTRTQDGDDGPVVSAYHLAQWLATNWWRIRTEGRPEEQDLDWWQSHNMIESANGFIWPNITIWREGDLLKITSEPTTEPSHLKYHGAHDGRPLEVTVHSFETTAQAFIESTIDQLEEAGETSTNLHLLAKDLRTERRSPALTQQREAEAREGRDPPYEVDHG
jgi:hypothetical protein